MSVGRSLGSLLRGEEPSPERIKYPVVSFWSSGHFQVAPQLCLFQGFISCMSAWSLGVLILRASAVFSVRATWRSWGAQRHSQCLNHHLSIKWKPSRVGMQAPRLLEGCDPENQSSPLPASCVKKEPEKGVNFPYHLFPILLLRQDVGFL